MSERVPYKIHVTTGEQRGAGTDANISITLHDTLNNASGPHSLDNTFRNDFERGQTDVFSIKCDQLNEVVEIELDFEEKGFAADWFCEMIKVEDVGSRKLYKFPVHRWFLKSKTHRISIFDSELPQHSRHPEQREKELEEKRKMYEYKENSPGLPLQVKEMPEEESFSSDIRHDIEATKFRLFAEKIVARLRSGRQKFESISEIMEMYDYFPSLSAPNEICDWKNDFHFGQQRLTGCNPKIIKLCTEIPENFNIDENILLNFLESKTLSTAIEMKRIFIVDLKILEGISTQDDKVLCAPLALFYVTDEKKIRPIAIQLFQNTDLVFYPNDDEYVWLLAKLWYNNADACYHQSCVHLSNTHLLMEGIAVCTKRHLSLSHPIYKLLAPHFLYIMAINDLGLKKLISPGGWVDCTLTTGTKGMFELMAKHHNDFMLNVDGDFVKDLEKRGVLDDILPNYYYRQDGLMIYEAIGRYVEKMVKFTYTNVQDIIDDNELQNWAKELILPRNDGLGLQGVPGDGKLDNHDDLIQLLRLMIFNCSCEHAASNFNQYNNYAYPPHYPASLQGAPPTDKTPKCEQDILDAIPSKSVMMDIMMITHILSTRSTQPLGRFEVEYHHHPQLLKIVKEFQKELKTISSRIQSDMENREPKYSILDPETVPNSISI